MAARVAMTAMPELVALLHSFVGAAAVLVGVSTYLDAGRRSLGAHGLSHVEIFLDVFIGAITFTGSVIAFLKLRERSRQAAAAARAPPAQPGRDRAR
jgi:NAD(P) transhydrogenase subunit beta